MFAALASCVAQPVYGAPGPLVDAADDAAASDAGVDAELAPDVVFTAEYGGPPADED
jgi:hypothetical protein